MHNNWGNYSSQANINKKKLIHQNYHWFVLSFVIQRCCITNYCLAFLLCSYWCFDAQLKHDSMVPYAWITHTRLIIIVNWLSGHHSHCDHSIPMDMIWNGKMSVLNTHLQFTSSLQLCSLDCFSQSQVHYIKIHLKINFMILIIN